jgi:hypothetical protein
MEFLRDWNYPDFRVDSKSVHALLIASILAQVFYKMVS